VEKYFAAEPDDEADDEPADEALEEPTDDPGGEPPDEPGTEAMGESVAAGANNSLRKPQDEAVSEPLDEPTDEPCDEAFGGATIAINRHDPDARLQRKTQEVAQFRYNVSFSADAESGLICDASADAWERAETTVAHVDQRPRACGGTRGRRAL